MKSTTKQPLKRKWTGPIDRSGKFHSGQTYFIVKYVTAFGVGSQVLTTLVMTLAIVSEFDGKKLFHFALTENCY